MDVLVAMTQNIKGRDVYASITIIAWSDPFTATVNLHANAGLSGSASILRSQRWLILSALCEFLVPVVVNQALVRRTHVFLESLTPLPSCPGNLDRQCHSSHLRLHSASLHRDWVGAWWILSFNIHLHLILTLFMSLSLKRENETFTITYCSLIKHSIRQV